MATIKQLNGYKNIVIKIGSSLIVDESGSIRKKWLSSLVQDVENLKKWVIALNVAIIPIIFAGLALMISLRRKRFLN